MPRPEKAPRPNTNNQEGGASVDATTNAEEQQRYKEETFQDDLDKSYESMKSDEKDPLHYNIDSDNEPPVD